MYIVLLKNNETGEERKIHHDEDWDDGSNYLWTEGNYSCDCNRHLFFERSIGRRPDKEEMVCGDIKYTAVYAELPDGTRYVLDKNEDE